MVVERGLARCPRCVSVADYVFIETVAQRTSERAAGGLRYEVRCRKCGECYGEDSRPVANLPATVAELHIEWPRDREPVEPHDWRNELLGHCSRAAQRVRAEFGEMVQHTRTLAAKRWFGRNGDGDDQTGG